MPSLTERAALGPGRGQPLGEAVARVGSATPEVSTRSCSSTDAMGVGTAAADLHGKKSTRRDASTARMKPAAADADVRTQLFRPTTTPPGARAGAWPGPGIPGNRVPRWVGGCGQPEACFPPLGHPPPGDPAPVAEVLARPGMERTELPPAGGGRRPRGRAPALSGCVGAAMELVPPDREAQTSLVLDAGGGR